MARCPACIAARFQCSSIWGMPFESGAHPQGGCSKGLPPRGSGIYPGSGPSEVCAGLRRGSWEATLHFMAPPPGPARHIAIVADIHVGVRLAEKVDREPRVNGVGGVGFGRQAGRVVLAQRSDGRGHIGKLVQRRRGGSSGRVRHGDIHRAGRLSRGNRRHDFVVRIQRKLRGGYRAKGDPAGPEEALSVQSRTRRPRDSGPPTTRP